MSSVPLTSGAVTRIYNNGPVDKPYVQLLEIKRIGAPAVQNAQERFRLIVSDSAHYQQAMLATQLNPLVNDGKIRDGCIVQLNEYICNNISNRKIIIILGLQVVSDGNGQTIGNPVNIDGGATSTSTIASKPIAGAPQSRPTPLPYQPQRQTGPTTMSDNMTQHFYPISQLNPYQNKWTIKARVTNKSDMRTWQNEKSNGKLFSVDLLDQSGGQIKATMFNNAADKFFPMFQPDKVYTISKGQVKLANKNFNRCPNEYELTLNDDTEVTYYGEDDSIEQQKFVFKKIHEIASCEKEAHVDVIGIVTSVQPITNIKSSKTQKQVQKRSITIVDDTATQIELTLWGEQAERYHETELGNHAIIAIKQARVGDFQGKNLSASFTSQIFINPTFPEADALRSWWNQEGHTSQITSISGIRGAGGNEGHTDQRIVFADINTKGLGKNATPDYFSVRGTVTFFRHEGDKPPWYNACPNEKCNKKTVPDGQGSFHCANCNTNGGANPRYILSLLVCDSTGAQWLTAFNESAEKLLGHTAMDLSNLKETNPQAYEQVFTQSNFKPYVFKIRAKAETQSDEMRIRCHVLSAEPLDFVKESELLLKQIALYD